MRTVTGIYEGGVITLTEPATLKEKQKVTILIPEEREETLEPLRFAGMLRDLSPEEMVAFEQSLQRGLWFTRKVS